MTEENIVLGLSVGTTTIGIALISDRELVDWQVKTFPGKWSPYKLRVILQTLEQYMAKHRATELSLKVPDQRTWSPALHELIRSIQQRWVAKGMQCHAYDLKALKTYCEATNKEGFMQFIAGKYPELQIILTKQAQSKNHYYVKLFEAVGAALLA